MDVTRSYFFIYFTENKDTDLKRMIFASDVLQNSALGWICLSLTHRVMKWSAPSFNLLCYQLGAHVTALLSLVMLKSSGSCYVI